jgi:predicted RNA polymerase sigma factor
VRAHLLDMAGEADAARECYRRAARMTLSIPERRYLEAQYLEAQYLEAQYLEMARVASS